MSSLFDLVLLLAPMMFKLVDVDAMFMFYVVVDSLFEGEANL